MLYWAGLYAGGYVNCLLVISHTWKTYFKLKANVSCVYVQPSWTSQVSLWRYCTVYGFGARHSYSFAKFAKRKPSQKQHTYSVLNASGYSPLPLWLQNVLICFCTNRSWSISVQMWYKIRKYMFIIFRPYEKSQPLKEFCKDECKSD